MRTTTALEAGVGVRRSTVFAFVASLWLLCSGSGYAAVLLNDNFDTENGGVGTLNYSGFANFNIANAGSGGAADLIGNGFFDFYPGNGLYVDICGSSRQCAVLTTKQVFAPGNYVVTLGIAGNARSATIDAVNMMFGSFSASFPLSESQQATEVENVTLSAPSALTITDQGSLGPAIGDILLSVKIEGAGVAAPEPSSLALVSIVLVALGWLMSGRQPIARRL